MYNRPWSKIGGFKVVLPKTWDENCLHLATFVGPTGGQHNHVA